MDHPSPIEQKSKNRSAPWGPLAAIGMTVAVFFGSQIVVQFFAALYVSAQGWDQGQTESWLTGPVIQTTLVAASYALQLWAIWWFIHRRTGWRKMLGLDSPRITYLGYALIAFGVYFMLQIGVGMLQQSLLPNLNVDQQQELGFSTTTQGWPLLLIFFSLVILPPLVEEIICRGFLYGGLRRKLPVFIAALLTSTIFAAAHLQWGGDAPLLWVAAIDTFVLSMVLVYLREKTGSLWPCIGVHMLKNGLAFTVLFIFHAR
jgi:membrane protease YdiL (CAAX protease family)